MVDLDFFNWIQTYLKVGGLLYIEIPNPNEYINNARREYLYYLDRLHVNHFSLQAVNKLANKYGLKMISYGNHLLPYKDGEGYPAQFFFCKKTELAKYSMEQSISSYIDSENKKCLLDIDPELPIIVYGFGDNFFRCISPKGPLFEKNIITIVDQRWEKLSTNSEYQMFNFLKLDDAVEKFPDSPIVITVSWNSEQIAKQIQKISNSKIYFI